MADFNDLRTRLVRTLKNRLRCYPTMRSLYANAVYLHHALGEGLWPSLIRFSTRSNHSGGQQVLVWDTPFPRIGEPSELVTWLRKRELYFREGRNAIYLPPQERLKDFFPKVVEFYPPNAGFKILKDFRPPDEASYLAGNTLLVRTKLAGKPQDQLVTANYMYSLGLGPRVWDVCCWNSGSCFYTVFVVDHVEGSAPSTVGCLHFLERLRRITKETHLRILLPNWERNPEFEYPHFNNNILENESPYPLYVDFQNFGMTSSHAWTEEIINRAKSVFHFGGGRPWRKGSYLYQSIPGIPSAVGKRNTNKRWIFIMNHLNKAKLDLRGRVVLDVGCNAGMIIYLSLSVGAAWGLGWDRPNIVLETQDLLFSLGASRFHLIGAELNPTYQLEGEIPKNLETELKGSVIFYLSVYEHMGLLRSLERIPWRIFIYEGHQGERLESALEALSPLLTEGTNCIGSSYIIDGDSAARPMLILLRK